MKRILLIIGTRPETIKMAPVYHALRDADGMEALVCSSGQHREMLDQMTAFFGLPVDEELNVMTPGQDLFDITAKVLTGMREVLKRLKPDMILVQGDTTTVMAAGLAAFYLDIPVGHVEAGLRTWNMRNPFPEELNRVVTDALSNLHFAPTEGAKAALLKSGVSEASILVTGNTVIDALLFATEKLSGESCAAADTAAMDRYILLTSHRRESFGAPIRNTFDAVRALIRKYPDLHVVYPAHPNPNVREAIGEKLDGIDRVHILEAQPYPEFVKLMRDSTLILTDSGGVQEEAPTLGKPVLVLRETTERPEGVEAGTAKLIGTDTGRIVEETARLLDDPDAFNAMARAVNPYGDGQAGRRIADCLCRHLKG
jgi:UDP-N-acetylglucosamine 2-epimerase (non-hydrolysing)